MLAILEEERLWSLADSEGNPENSTAMEGLGFFHPPIPLGSSVQHLLRNRPVPFVQFCPAEPTLLLTGHGYALTVRAYHYSLLISVMNFHLPM